MLFRCGGHSILQTDPRTDLDSVTMEATRKPKDSLGVDQGQGAQGLREFSTKQVAGKASQERQDSLRLLFFFIS